MDIQLASLTGQFDFGNAAPLTLVFVADANAVGNCVPFKPSAVMLACSAFPTWMMVAAYVYFLPCRVAGFVAKAGFIGPVIDKHFSAMTTRFRDAASFRPALFRAKPRSLAIGWNFKSRTADFACHCEPVAFRSDSASAEIAASRGAKAPPIFIRLERSAALFAHLFHACSMSRKRPTENKYVADIERRMAQAKPHQADIFAGAAA